MYFDVYSTDVEVTSIIPGVVDTTVCHSNQSFHSCFHKEYSKRKIMIYKIAIIYYGLGTS